MDLYTMAVMRKPTTVRIFSESQDQGSFVTLSTVDLVRLGFTLQFGECTTKVE